MAAQSKAQGPDFAAGVPVAQIPEGGTLAGRVGDEPVLVSRRPDAFFAVGGACTHYGGPLSEGLIAGDEVRCPWHHACFNLRTGEASAAPAFTALPQWRVEVRGETVFVREQAAQAEAASSPARSQAHPGRIVIVGGGAAGFAAADGLRRKGFSGALTMLSADASAPYDRPNLSKDYLAGSAPEEWIPLKHDAFYRERQIDVRLNVAVAKLDAAVRKLITRSGETLDFDALLLATGASPVRLSTPGFERPNVFTLRSLADSRAIIAAAEKASSVAIIGAGFIGLETAASMRARGLETHVVAPDETPLQRVLGQELGGFVRSVHEQHGVRFHLGRTAEGFDGRRLRLDDGAELAVDFVIVGVGVRPNEELAAAAGLDVQSGVLVDDRLRTRAPGVFAAGDVARYPDARLGEHIRVEHWVAAQRQGQIAAANMLGEDVSFTETPFFWSNHYDNNIRYVGHAGAWDRLEIEGSPAAGDCAVRYYKGDRIAAVATLGRDREALEVHQRMNAEAPSAPA